VSKIGTVGHMRSWDTFGIGWTAGSLDSVVGCSDVLGRALIFLAESFDVGKLHMHVEYD